MRRQARNGGGVVRMLDPMTGADEPEPGDEPWVHGARRPIEELAAALLGAVDAGRGFSAVRLGDGEGAVLCAPDPDEAYGAIIQRIWFGDQRLTRAEMEEIGEGVAAAAADADILGLPTRFHSQAFSRSNRVFTGLRARGLPRPAQLLTDGNLHWYLQFSGAFGLLLRDRPAVGIVGARDVGEAVRQAFGIARTPTWLVRGESDHPGGVTTRHWPDGFRAVLDTLEVERPGQPFLVGAGALGKIYCRRIKALGGVAIDVGSVLDGWCGVPSRLRYPRYPQLYSLERAAHPPAGGLRAALDQGVAEAELPAASY